MLTRALVTGILLVPLVAAPHALGKTSRDSRVVQSSGKTGDGADAKQQTKTDCRKKWDALGNEGQKAYGFKYGIYTRQACG
jgi:hypothetical protein